MYICYIHTHTHTNTRTHMHILAFVTENYNGKIMPISGM